MCDFEKSAKQIHQSFCGSHISWSLDLKNENNVCRWAFSESALIDYCSIMQKGVLYLHLSYLHPPIRLFLLQPFVIWLVRSSNLSFDIFLSRNMYCTIYGCIFILILISECFYPHHFCLRFFNFNMQYFVSLELSLKLMHTSLFAMAHYI